MATKPATTFASPPPRARTRPVEKKKSRRQQIRHLRVGVEGETADPSDPDLVAPLLYVDERKELSRRRFEAMGSTSSDIESVPMHLRLMSGDVTVPAVMPRGCPIRFASAALLNNVVKLGDEKTPPQFRAEVLNAMRSLFPAGKVYKFDMFANTSVGTASVGVVFQSLSVSPAVVSYAEWPTLSALFDECKLVRAQLEFIPLVGSDGQNLSSSTPGPIIQSAWLCGVNYVNINTAPASYAAVGRLAKAAQIIRTIADTRGQSVFTMRCPRSLPYARTAVPAVLDPPAGMLGSFDVGTDVNTLSTNTVYYRNILRTTVALRMRA